MASRPETPVQHGGDGVCVVEGAYAVGAVEQFIEVVALERQLAGASGR
jgi:hypothetical protein